jgi:hypothetical protein
MRYRKLRIAWSVGCAIACVLLIMLWVRSYWWIDGVTVFMPGDRYVGARAICGCIEIGEYRNTEPMDWRVVLNSWSMANEIIPQFQNLGFHFRENSGGYTKSYFPIWFATIFIMLCGFAVWLPWRFSLRSLLIATTLVAVVLGFVAYATSSELPLWRAFFMRSRMGAIPAARDKLAFGIRRSKMRPVLIGSIVFQGFAVAIALFLPFGFDHPSSLGLDFGHFLLVLSLYAVALIVGVVIAFATHRYLLAVIQLAVPAVIFFLGFVGLLNI